MGDCTNIFPLCYNERMNNVKSDDYIIYKKSKRRVIGRLIFTFICLCAYFIGVFYIMNLDVLKLYDSKFNLILIGGIIAQLCIYTILFIMLASGKKGYRILYWLTFLVDLAILYYPVSTIIETRTNLASYGVLTVCMLLKLYILYRQGIYLHTNASAKVFFDHVVEVNEEGDYRNEEFNEDIEHPEEAEESDLPVIPKPPMDFISSKKEKDETNWKTDDIEYMELTSHMSYKQLAIRLGIVIYLSLMVFPIIIQIFSSFFYSYDQVHIFATKDIFVLCIFTAMVWTIPVFYLYYNHPTSKKIVQFCFIAEIGVTVYYLFHFIGYMRNEDVQYSAYIYVAFLALDILRYFLLFVSIRPIFKIPVPEKPSEDFD